MAEISTAPSTTGARDRILQEAFSRFIEAGYATVSMQQIADAAGITKATLYHHFRDKEDLFFEVMRTGFLRSQDTMNHQMESGKTLQEQLNRFASYIFSSERADLNRLFGDFHQHVAPERQATFWATFKRPWTYLEAPIAAAIERGELRQGDPSVIARVFFSAMAGQLQIARFEESVPEPDDALAAEIVDILLNGLRPE